jgi:ABC-type branched-subunit amino acid transport system ATPase component/ABC-type branched-subunit amino acid transport system permease subunit
LRTTWALPAAVLLVLISESAGSYWRFVAGIVVIYGVTSMGLTVLTGLSGQISLAHVAMFGFGAYTEAILMTRTRLALPIALLVAVIAGTVVAVLVGLALSRLSGLAFAISTLGVAIIFQRVVDQWTPVTGGHLGLYVQTADLFGFVLTNFGLYLVLLLLFVLAATGASLLRTGALGRRMLAVKGSPIAATGVGISVAGTKLLAFAIAGGYAALGGAMYAAWAGYLSPDQFTVNVSVLFLAIVVLGALKSPAGALIAAAVLVGVPQFFQEANRWTLIVNGALLILATLVVGGDLTGRLRKLVRRKPIADLDEREHRLDSAALPAWLADGATRSATLAVSGVGIAFGGVRALRDVSVSVRSGEVVAVIGPNGAGKSTLLNVITGLYRADEGVVELDDVSVVGTAPHRFAKLGVARTYQSAQKWPELTVIEHVAVAHPACARPRVAGEMVRSPSIRRRDRLVDRECRQLLGFLGMADRADRPVGDLPHGELQLLQLARALISRPTVLLLDEISAGLTADESAALGVIIRDLAHEHGLAVLVIAHDMPLVMRSADRVVVLDAGQCIAGGTPDQVRADQAVIAAYLGTQTSTTGEASRHGN